MSCFYRCERTLDPAYAERLGIDLSELIISQPDSAEGKREIAEILTRSGAIDLLAIDLLQHLFRGAELENKTKRSLCGDFTSKTYVHDENLLEPWESQEPQAFY
ncbi:MAG: hypothetical protein R2883_06065 [Caldisericia bacterium]